MTDEEMFKEIARQYRTTPERVKQEIDFAIRDAMKNPDPNVQAFWKAIAPDGKAPTPERFIKIMAALASLGNER